MSPTVSLIVPVRDRPELLRRLLVALSQQTYRDFEVIVVDDGSTEPLAKTIACFADARMQLRALRTTGVGAVRARCMGVNEARGRILAFTDSDCEPEPAWLEEGVRSVMTGADVVQGVTVPVRPPGPFDRTISFAGGEGLFATCNVFYRRGAFDAAGGFDSAAEDRLGFRPGARAKGLGFGEDVLLGWRVARAGRFEVAQRAIVRHAVDRDPPTELLSRTWQIGAFPALVREVPELRDTLLRGRVFIGTASRVPLYMAAAAAALGCRRLAAASVIAWVVLTARRAPRRRGVATAGLVVARDLLLDVIKAAALVAGSLRAGTPVL